MVRKTLRKGDDTRISGVFCQFFGLPKKDILDKSLSVPEDEAIDNIHRNFHVVYRESSKKNLEPDWLLWFSIYDWPGNGETYLYRASPKGELWKIVRLNGKNDEDGKPIPGSGVVTHMDETSYEMKARFQRELDFWLKGMYRKKSKAGADSGASSKTK